MQTRQATLGLVLILTLLKLTPQTAGGVTYYVEPNGVDAPGTDGLSWLTAFASVKYAVGRAASSDTVLVSNGFYNVTSATAMNKNITVESLNGSAYTILDGGGVGSFGAFVTGGATNTIVLRGLTMTNFVAGNGVVSVSGDTNMWYMYDCVFTGNRVNVGGGLCISYRGSVATLYDCVIKHNYANGQRGGGVYIYGTTYNPPIPGTLRAFRCTIASNTAPQASAAGQAGAGIFMLAGAVCELDDCRIVGNDAGIGRGAGISAGSADVTISNSVISGNIAPGGHAGAYLSGTNIKIANSKITDNIVTNGTAGGLYISGGIIESCLIAGNSANGRAGGAEVRGDCIVRNCTVVGNSGSDRGGLDRGPAAVINTIVYNNTAVSANSNYYSADLIYYTNSILAPDPAAKGTDCLVVNPMIDVDYKPIRKSPTINAGLYETWMDNATDLDGLPRLDKYSGVPDIGAYEYVPPERGTVFRSH